MEIDQNDILILKQRELEFTGLVGNSSHSELAKCTKFLAMYLALYRQQFGDIPAADFSHLLQRPTLDRELLQIIGEGMQEASAMLKMILLQGGDPDSSNGRLLN